MQLSEIVTLVTDEMNKGSALSTSTIQTRIRMALQNLESVEDWQYMKTFDDAVAIVSGDRTLTLNSRIKSIEFLRIINDDGTLDYLNEVDPERIDKRETKQPTGYWKSGTSTLYFDNTPDQAYSAEMLFHQYTTWSAADTFEPWLFQEAFPLVIAETNILCSMYLKEFEQANTYAPVRQEALQNALRANDELMYKNKEFQMVYQ